MHAIKTKFHGPTNHRGSRISARAMGKYGKTVWWSYDHGITAHSNHAAAARQWLKVNGHDYANNSLMEGDAYDGYVFISIDIMDIIAKELGIGDGRDL